MRFQESYGLNDLRSFLALARSAIFFRFTLLECIPLYAWEWKESFGWSLCKKLLQLKTWSKIEVESECSLVGWTIQLRSSLKAIQIFTQYIFTFNFHAQLVPSDFLIFYFGRQISPLQGGQEKEKNPKHTNTLDTTFYLHMSLIQIGKVDKEHQPENVSSKLRKYPTCTQICE
jgi:hypothetical protein